MSDPNLIPVDDAMLGAFLAGETDAAENEAIRQWLSASPENKKHFDDFSRIWNSSENLNQWPDADTDAAWSKVKAQTIHKKSSPRRWYFAAAAAAVLLLVSITIFNIPGGEQNPVSFATTSSSQTFVLADGSKVTLNKNSQLIPANDFGKEQRNVQLIGEGFFEIAPDAKHPFTVHTGDLDVQVLGTAFNVSAYNRDSITVSVDHGRVKCKAVSGESEEILVKDEYARFTRNNQRVEKIDGGNKNSMAWKNHVFVFDNAPLSEVSSQISEVYNVKIVIRNSELINEPISTTFNNKTLDQVLSVLKEYYGMNIKQEGALFVMDR